MQAGDAVVRSSDAHLGDAALLRCLGQYPLGVQLFQALGDKDEVRQISEADIWSTEVDEKSNDRDELDLKDIGLEMVRYHENEREHEELIDPIIWNKVDEKDNKYHKENDKEHDFDKKISESDGTTDRHQENEAKVNEKSSGINEKLAPSD